MTDSTAVQEWLQVHRLLMEHEEAFADLALQAAAGQISLEELANNRERLISLRTRCSAAYENAFPPSAR